MNFMFDWIKNHLIKAPREQLKVARFEPLGKLDTRFWKQVVKTYKLNDDPDYRLKVTSNNLTQPDELTDCLSWCSQLPESEFDYIVFMPSSKLVDNLWTLSFLVQRIKSLKYGGRLIIPIRKNDPNSISVDLLKKVSTITNITPSATKTFNGLEFLKSGGYCDQTQDDIFGWFVENSRFIFEFFALNQQLEKTSPNQFLGKKSDNLIIDADDIKLLNADFISQEKADLERFLVFSIYGVQQKTYALKRIITDIFENKDVSWADIGSGSGWVAIQMLIELGSRLKVTNYEKSLSQAVLGAEAIKHFGAVPNQNFRTVVSRVDSKGLLKGESYQLITLITTLCYIEKENQLKLLRDLWLSLETGGYLVIFENIRSESYTRDYDLMFDESGLSQLLSEFVGERSYRHPLHGNLIDEAEAVGKTCYRLIRKL
jgi:precorrin-6B methylase 2